MLMISLKLPTLLMKPTITPPIRLMKVVIAMIALGLILMRQSSVRQAAAAATDAGPVPMEEVTNARRRSG